MPEFAHTSHTLLRLLPAERIELENAIAHLDECAEQIIIEYCELLTQEPNEPKRIDDLVPNKVARYIEQQNLYL